MQVTPPRYRQNDGFGPDTHKDPRVPRDGSYWPAGLPRGLPGAIELLKADARFHDWSEGQRRARVGLPPLTESVGTAQRLWTMARKLEKYGIPPPPKAPGRPRKGPIPTQRRDEMRRENAR